MRLKIKIGSSEIEFEGDLNEISSILDIIPKIIDATKGTPQYTLPASISQDIQKSEAVGQEQVSEEVPTIQVSKDDSIADIIMKIMGSQWGRKPRRLEDIKKALETLGFPLSRSTVAVTLLRLTQSGKLRRFKDDKGEFCYSTLASNIEAQIQA
ncbi:MAG: BlaI/MecI/CopY family transcriptional regulator [Nitrososphaeria archaeon]